MPLLRFLLLFVFVTTLSNAQTLDLSKIENLKIRNVGPANMSGRITAIDVATHNPKLMYVRSGVGWGLEIRKRRHGLATRF